MKTELFENLIGNFDVGISAWNREGACLYANKITSQVLGISLDVLLSDFCIYDIHNCVYADGTAINPENNPITISFERRHRVKDIVIGIKHVEHVVWIRLSTFLDKFESNDCVFIYFTDITEEYNKSEIHRIEQIRSKSLLYSIPDLVLGLSPDNYINNVEGQYSSFPLPIDNILGKDLTYVFNKEIAEIFDVKIENLRISGKMQEFDFSYLAVNRKLYTFEVRMRISQASEIIVLLRDVTNHRIIERDKIEVERTLSTLIGNLHGMVYRCLLDQQWTMLFVSDAVVNLTGYSEFELTYNKLITYGALIHPDDRKYVRDIVEESRKENNVFYLEYRIISKNGDTKWVAEQGRIIKNEYNVDIYIEGYINDISDRKHALTKLKHTNIRFKTLFNALNQSVLVSLWNNKGESNFVSSNNFASGKYLYTETEFKQINIFDIIAPESKTKFQNEFISKLELFKNSYAEIKNIDKKSSVFDVSINATLMIVDGLTYVQYVINDISNRINNEKIRLYRANLLKLTSEISSDFMNTDSECISLTINKSIAKLGKIVGSDRVFIYRYNHSDKYVYYDFEWSKEKDYELINIVKKIPVQDCKKWIQKLNEGTHILVEDFSKIPSNNKPELVDFYRIKTALLVPMFISNKLYGCIGFDFISKDRKWFDEDIAIMYTIADIISAAIQRNKNDRKLIQAKQKAEEGDLLKSRFLASMSHELRTPLNAIIGFSSLVEKEDELEKLQKWNKIINTSGKHLLNLIESIFDISMLESRQIKTLKQEVPLNEFLNEINSSVSPSLMKYGKENLKIKYFDTSKDSSCVINTDKTKLRQVLQNLIINAIKYTLKGSIKLGYIINGDDINFFVADTGIGIHSSKQEMIFKSFTQIEQSSSTKKGVGIGLAICKEIAEILEGHIWVESELGQGSNFYFRLNDVVRWDIKKLSDNAESCELIDLRGKTILIVDDLEANSLLIEAMLHNTGVTVVKVDNGIDAISKAKKGVDVVLMDIKMKKMSGFEAARLIKNNNPNMPIIAQTAYMFGDEDMSRYKQYFNFFISKPFSKSELLSVIYRLVT
ncbi:MAG: ATP-binding protein [Marinifilaceae bacterium]|jgi:PAS domain S-box-containing protein|nr:ATP-binding protein [Marinifilaceae bacterium]